MTTRRLLLATALSTALLLSGCGSIADDGGGAAAGEAPPGVTDTAITIGATLPLTGTAAVAGQGLEAGLRIAADEINAAGGINGRQVELVLLDDAFAPDRVVTNVRRLVSQEGVYALVAPAGSQGLPGTWSFISENGTPVWGPVSPGDPELDEVYLLSATRKSQIQVAIDYYAAQGLTDIGVIRQNNDLGVSMTAALTDQMPKHPEMRIVAEQETQTGSTDVSSAVNNIIAANPQAVLLATDNTQVGLILQGLRNRGVTVPVFADQGGAGTGGPSAIGPAGAAAEGLIGGMQVDTVSTDNPDVEHWRGLAQQYSGEQGTSGFSLQTYSSLRAFAELVQRMGDDMGYANFQAVAEGLREDPISLGAIPDIECGPLPGGHTCVNQAGLAIVRGGQWQILQEFQAPS